MHQHGFRCELPGSSDFRWSAIFRLSSLFERWPNRNSSIPTNVARGECEWRSFMYPRRPQARVPTSAPVGILVRNFLCPSSADLRLVIRLFDCLQVRSASVRPSCGIIQCLTVRSVHWWVFEYISVHSFPSAEIFIKASLGLCRVLLAKHWQDVEIPNTRNGCYGTLFVRDKFLIGCGLSFHEQLEKVFFAVHFALLIQNPPNPLSWYKRASGNENGDP